MVKYERPVVSVVGGFGEGIYMASGDEDVTLGGGSGTSTTCWDVSCPSVQDWDGSNHVFEVRTNHSASVLHITNNVEYNFTFNGVVTYARSEMGTCTYSGNTVSVVRDLHANGYNSGDAVTFKIWVQGADDASTRAMACTYAAPPICTHMTNVQGQID